MEFRETFKEIELLIICQLTVFFSKILNEKTFCFATRQNIFWGVNMFNLEIGCLLHINAVCNSDGCNCCYRRAQTRAQSSQYGSKQQRSLYYCVITPLTYGCNSLPTSHSWWTAHSTSRQKVATKPLTAKFLLEKVQLKLMMSHLQQLFTLHWYRRFRRNNDCSTYQHGRQMDFSMEWSKNFFPGGQQWWNLISSTQS